LASLSQTELHAFVDDLQLGIGDLHDAIAQTWFPPLPAATDEAA
jgi:hypothetical protein